MIVDDGALRAVLGGVFGALYGSGTLTRVTLVDDAKGGWTESTTDHTVKVQVDRATEDMRSAADAGYAGRDAKIIVLQQGVAVVPTTDDRLTYRGLTWRLSQVQSDPAQSHWIAYGVQQ